MTKMLLRFNIGYYFSLELTARILLLPIPNSLLLINCSFFRILSLKFYIFNKTSIQLNATHCTTYTRGCGSDR